MKSYLSLLLLIGLTEARRHHAHHGQGGLIENKLKQQANETGNLEGGLVRSTLGPSEDALDHLDSVKNDSDEEQYLKDAPKGYDDTFAFLMAQHKEFMMTKAQDTVIVPVTFRVCINRIC